MTQHVILRLQNSRDTYMVDLVAGTVSKIEGDQDLDAVQGGRFEGVDVAVAATQREATATFPGWYE